MTYALFLMLALFTCGVRQEIPANDRLQQYANYPSFLVRIGVSSRGFHVFHDGGEVITTPPHKIERK